MSNVKNKLIPELRFPEFENEKEWEETTFEELFTIGNGRDYKHLDRGEIPVYGSGGYMLSVNDFLYDGESVCIGRKGTIDKPMFLKGKFWTVDTLFYTHSFKDCTPKYIYYVFQNINWLKHNEAGGVPSLSKANIYKIEIAIPSIKEQKKIASILSSLDEVITVESQKLENLKTNKKGLMQNLFPQEGKKVPKFRFKEFENDGEWNIKELNQLGSLINGLTYSPDDIREKGLLVLRSSNIQNGLIDLNDCVFVSTDVKGVNLSQPNDILVCVRNGSKNLIGKNAIIPKGLSLATHGAFMTVFRAGNPEFVFQLFQTDFYDKQVKADLGATINSINGKNFLKYKFPVPKNPKEQIKIATCLSSLDNLITAQAEKIEQLNLHKKGLMQGLFPKVNS